MNTEETAKTSNLTGFTELKGDLVDRLDKTADKLTQKSPKKSARSGLLGKLAA